MIKGLYNCLFCCADIQFYDCFCDTLYQKIVQQNCRANKHKLAFLCENECPYCVRIEPVEGVWIFKTESLSILDSFFSFNRRNEIEYREFEGRLSSIKMLTKNNKVKEIKLVDLSIFPSSRLSKYFTKHDAYIKQKEIEVKLSRLEWLKCSLRIGRKVINKDIALKIALLLDKEPFYLHVEQHKIRGIGDNIIVVDEPAYIGPPSFIIAHI